MISIEQEKLIYLATELEEWDDKKKELNKEKNELLEGFLEENNLEKDMKKQVLSAIKDYRRYQKDMAKYNMEESIKNQLLDKLTGEKCI